MLAEYPRHDRAARRSRNRQPFAPRRPGMEPVALRADGRGRRPRGSATAIRRSPFSLKASAVYESRSGRLRDDEHRIVAKQIQAALQESTVLSGSMACDQWPACRSRPCSGGPPPCSGACLRAEIRLLSSLAFFSRSAAWLSSSAMVLACSVVAAVASFGSPSLLERRRCASLRTRRV